MGVKPNEAPYVITQQADKLKMLLSRQRSLRQQLQRIVDEIPESSADETTGWFVLLEVDRKALSGFALMGIFNPDVCEEGEEPEWDIAIPIPKPGTVPEFEGW